MKNSLPARESAIGRRDFIKVGAGAAAAISMLNLVPARAQAPSPQGVPWWAARPGKAGVGAPAAIDMHAHWSPELYNQALAQLGQPIANPFPLDYDLDKRRQWMDDHGDLMHCLTLSGAMPWQRTTAIEGAHLAQVINDAGIQAHQKHPDRFVIGVELPIRDSELALKELNRVAGQPGVRAVHLPDSIENHDYLFDPGFAPVLARIQELNYPIIFHQMDGVPNTFGGSRTAGPPNLAPGIDAPIEHTFLASKFIYTGSLDKYPNLQIVLPHAGGAFPYLAGRVEHFLFHMNDRGTSIAHPFRDYLRRFHYDYLIYYPEAFRFLMELVGSDRIVVGTDHFAARDVDYPTAVLDQFNLTAADRDRILKGNAMRLLHL
ncbi:MAG TPA: amidohydrolase family protein [Bryobacteraceae bacterium]|jgi:aminocarboxymuconate-semialdehyde decarboxylase|nr:amidohydrolase family protein [Bryobacteraceae bacterium]